MENKTITGLVIDTEETTFDIISCNGKVKVSQEFIENISKTFEREFGAVNITEIQ
jgi:hypothetical protein